MTHAKETPALLNVERLFADFIRSNIGLAVLDERLCYQAVNPFLATSNGTPAESHIGKHVREILGGVAAQVEPSIRQVFRNGRPVINCELAGPLPSKPDGGHWIDSFFPIADSNGNVKHVGAMVVELPLDLGIHPGDVNVAPVSPVLRSWKDIAHYVQACVKTVQRWERAYNFPIQRLSTNKGAVVFALRNDVDSWLRGSSRQRESARVSGLVPTSIAVPPLLVRLAGDRRSSKNPAFESERITRKATRTGKPRSS